MPMRVVICDDHPVVRTGVRIVLSRELDIAIVGEASNGQQAVHLVHELTPDVLVLDIEMPGMSGVDVIRAIRSTPLTTRILILSAHAEAQYVATIISIGANGFLTKDEAQSSIVAAVRGVAGGEGGWFSRSVTARMLAGGEAPQLSERERAVLHWLVRGKTNHGIADQLGTSEKSVERNLGSLFEKLGVSSRVEAAVRAVREHLVS